MNKARGFLLAVAVAMALTVSCDIKGIGGGGTFTLTGIPAEYNGKYAAIPGALVSAGVLLGYQNMEPTRLSQISNGSVSISMWVVKVGGPVRYSGNTTSSAVTVGIYNTNSIEKKDMPIAAAMFTSPTTFSNGNATRDWSEMQGANLQPTTKGGSL